MWPFGIEYHFTRYAKPTHFHPAARATILDSISWFACRYADSLSQSLVTRLAAVEQ